MIDHLKIMAEVRPGLDGQASRWALDEIERLRLEHEDRSKLNHARAKEIERLRDALDVVAGFGTVPLAQEWPEGLRDIIRAMTDCASAALNSKMGRQS